jgi:SAM-dependent methyltransferase
MFALPFPDHSFDVATSFNGIWKGCEGALEEARRVLVPAGHFGATFWGRYQKLGLMPYFSKVIELSPPSHGRASMEQGDTRHVMEDMLRKAGFVDLEQGTVDVVNEWPDVPTAVRALAAAGPSVPAIEAVGYEEFCRALVEVMTPLHADGLGVRVTSELGWVTARAAP